MAQLEIIAGVSMRHCQHSEILIQTATKCKIISYLINIKLLLLLNRQCIL